MLTMDHYMPVRLFFGERTVFENRNEFKKLGKRCLIVTGGTSAVRSGALADVAAVFAGLDIAHQVFDEIEPNPQTDTCHRAGNAAREFGADFILGIGGGSPLDAAKVVGVFAKNEQFAPSDIYARGENPARLPVALIGTTAGTGSEVTSVSVLTESVTGRKRSTSSDDLYAAVSFCDPRYTASMPYDVTVSTALDAFAHAAESLLSSARDEMSALYAQRAVTMLWPVFEQFYENKSMPDAAGRAAIYAASLFAGFALNSTGTLFPHTLGYVLSEDFHVPHGKACAAFHAFLFNRSKQYLPGRFAEILSLCACGERHFFEVITSLADVRIAMTEEQIAAYCARWAEGVGNFDRSPGGFTAGDAARALRALR
ncbi:MAG: iron-containing alcohol dehydrogenase [Oscillospiraceae bacterium]|nr:iron-containing alcohol dehydrogenase [Oscillospiraceae bacterium]